MKNYQVIQQFAPCTNEQFTSWVRGARIAKPQFGSSIVLPFEGGKTIVLSSRDDILVYEDGLVAAARLEDGTCYSMTGFFDPWGHFPG
jgi:hypothetical protein